MTIDFSFIILLLTLRNHNSSENTTSFHSNSALILSLPTFLLHSTPISLPFLSLHPQTPLLKKCKIPPIILRISQTNQTVPFSLHFIG